MDEEDGDKIENGREAQERKGKEGRKKLRDKQRRTLKRGKASEKGGEKGDKR